MHTNKHPLELIPDYAVIRLLEAVGEDQSCAVCKNRDNAVLTAMCVDCKIYMCGQCSPAHGNFNSIYDKHKVVRLAEIAQADERPLPCMNHPNGSIRYLCVPCRKPVCNECLASEHLDHSNLPIIQEFYNECVGQFVQILEHSRGKAVELKNNIKNMENTAALMSNQFNNAQKLINSTYSEHIAALEDCRNNNLNELQGIYTSNQQYLSKSAEKAQEAMEAISQTVEFIEKHKKYSNFAEILMHRPNIEDTLIHHVMSNANPQQNIRDLEFVTNIQAIPQTLKSSFGYVRSASEFKPKMAPIARPSTSNSVHNMNSLNNVMNSMTLSNNFNLPSSPLNNPVSQQQINALATQLNQQLHQQQQNQNNPNNMYGNNTQIANTIAALTGNGPVEQRITPYNNANSQISQILNNTRSYSSTRLPAIPNGLSDYNNLNDKPSSYGKYGSSEVSLFSNEMQQTTPNMLNSFPPRSQIKRQKMIYHAKFGEFGVVEGQFTEPSGVAVNAQNDIIVADTNNHRIQIFDKEGRFKFQFGECGKRDGQLLYPNRVAVVRNSGDIIVTERSPTHQIQIYNQYGQFVRKFGANTLCYPRGVTVDNKGLIIVVECKVMRVIIFDQYGNTLHTFNCPSHLEFPNGVVVNDKQEIFISDNRAHCVKVIYFLF